MKPRLDQLTALGGFLADTDYNGAALKECVRTMHDAVAQEVGSPAKARRLLLDAMPAGQRAIVAAMLPQRSRGRPNGARLNDVAYRKAFALYDMYAHYWAKHGKAMAALAELASLRHAEIDSVKRQLVRAKKRLTVADRNIIETVAGEMRRA